MLVYLSEAHLFFMLVRKKDSSLAGSEHFIFSSLCGVDLINLVSLPATISMIFYRLPACVYGRTYLHFNISVNDAGMYCLVELAHENL